MHAKNQDRSPRKISRQRQFFSAGFISVSRDFTPYFHFRCVARATFDRNLNHSADACFLVMACVAYSRVKLKTLSSLLKQNNYANYGRCQPTVKIKTQILLVLDDVHFKGSSRNAFSSMESSFYFRRRIFVVV